MSLPWIVAAIALLAFIALIAGQRFGSTPSAEQVPAGDAANAAPVVSGGRAPDISQMSAAERADRLHNRILTLRQEGKQDSVMMFAPMGIAAYEMLPNLDNHARYDLGMIADASENATLARAEADTILRSAPDNLLGLILAARAAKMQNRSTDERRYYQRLVAVEKAERAKQLDEYLTHDNDITIALDEARRTIRR